MEPHWSLPAQLSIENIETHNKCWGIVAAGRSSKASDLKVEVHTDEEFDLIGFLDMVESDDEAMVDRARLAALNQAWKDRQQHLMQEINSGKLLPPEQTDCEDEDKYCDGAALEINAKLAKRVAAPDKDFREFKLSWIFCTLIGLLGVVSHVCNALILLMRPRDLFVS